MYSFTYTHKTLTDEIKHFYEEILRRGQRTKKEFIVAAVLAAHELPNLPDFYMYTAMEHVKDAVGAYLSKRLKRDDDVDGRQISFDFKDFDCLQPMYQVEVKKGESWLVPLEAMTDEEIDAKADEHDQHGAGHYLHRDELRRYKKMRQHAQAAIARVI